MDTTGYLRLLGRKAHLQSPYNTGQATFGDGPGEIGYQQLGDYTLDLDLVTNVVRRTNGESVIEASDAASIASYGKRDQTQAAEVKSQYLTPTAEYDLAAFRLAHYTQPVAYVDRLKIMPRTDPSTLWPIALGRGITDRVTFNRRPQGVGSAISKEVIIEGVSHTIGPKKWEVEFAIDAIDAPRYFLFDSTTWGSADWRFAA